MDIYRIQDAPIDTGEAVQALLDPTCGGQALFLGVVRNEFQGRQSAGLEYDAHVSLAEREMSRIGEEIRLEFGVRHVVMVHRIGRLDLGEASVLIAVAAPHRHAALDACEAAIDRLKSRVPIFKRELWADGEAGWHGEPGGPPVAP
jgi:molybdopterin synthase catalytic subunit